MLGSAILAAQALLLSGDNDACSRLLPGVASGESTLALCWAGAAGWSTFGVEATEDALTGTASYVLDGHIADTLLVLTADGFYEGDPEAEGVSRRRVPTMDPTRTLAEVTVTGVRGRPLARSEDEADGNR